MKRWLMTVILVVACTDFTDVPRDVCGNGLLEAGEDCDSDDVTCVRCAVACDAPIDCPTTDYTCGVDGFCHAPGGVLADPTAPVTFQADDLRITDIDRDGTRDVVGVSKTSILVRHGDASGSLLAASSFVTPVQSGPHAFGDLDGDGSIDVTLTTPDGVVAFTSRFGTLSPIAIESPLFDEAGNPLDLRHLFAVGQQQFGGISISFQLGAFIFAGGAMQLVVVDTNPFDPKIVAEPPCGTRLGALTPDRLPLGAIDIYKASETAQGVDFVISMVTSTGQLCVMSIAGSQAAGFTIVDITPAGAGAMTTRPVLADVDNDNDGCPSLVSSDGGAKALRHWNGKVVGGRCILDPAGPDGLLLPPVAEAPAEAVAIGRIPIDPQIIIPFPPFPATTPDAIVLTSGVYNHVPAAGAIVEIYSSSARVLAHVATGDLDNDGDIDAVLATANEDDLDVLFRFPLGLQLVRVDTASITTSLTIGDYDGNGLADVAYTELETDHQNMMIAYNTTDRLLPPVQVASFSGVSSVSPLQFPDSVDTLGIATDLAVIHLETGGLPTMSLLHGSPQRTMLSFFDPRSGDPDDNENTNNNPQEDTILRTSVVGDFDGDRVHPDLLLVATPQQDSLLGMRAWRASGTDNGLDNTPNPGLAANGLTACDGLGVCVANAEYLAWPAGASDVVIAIDRQVPPRAALIDPAANDAGFEKTDLPILVDGVPPGALVRSLHAADLDGDGQPELVVTFADRNAPAGVVRVCTMTAAGVPQACDDVQPAIAAIDSSVTACIDAAPGKIRERGPAIEPTPGLDLVVLCHAAGTTALYRLALVAGELAVTPLARASGLRAVRVDDVTGDGVHDIVAIQGSGGSQSAIVFVQCTSRDTEGCRAVAGSEAP